MIPMFPFLTAEKQGILIRNKRIYVPKMKKKKQNDEKLT